MDVIKFFIDYKIPHSTDHKNIRDGWIGIQDCPFCGTRGTYHLGYNTYENYFSCWSCGGHSEEYVVSKLIGVNYDTAKEIVEKYGGALKSRAEPRVRVGMSIFRLPNGLVPFNSVSWTYLHKRGFEDPDKLIKDWDLRFAGPSAKLDNHSYYNRILAPIYWDRRIVSFQARSILKNHPAKYKACPPEFEKISLPGS